MDTSTSSARSVGSAAATSISVAVRLRPIAPKDGPAYKGFAIDQEAAKVVITSHADKRSTFSYVGSGHKDADESFNRCYDDTSTQADVFESVQPMWVGYRACLC